MSSQDPGLSCPSCGAPVDVRRVEDTSGWTQLPAVKDMARIQFGQSTCQISGTMVPVADVNLDGNESVFFSHHVILYKDDGVTLEAMRMKGGWQRSLAGMPLLMCTAGGKGHIAFSQDLAGEIVALPIQVGTAVEVREHTMLIASGTTSYDWVPSNLWFTVTERDGNQEKQVTHHPMGMFLDRFFAQQRPGLVLLHAKGNAFVRTLAPGQSILVKPTSVLYKDLSVGIQLHLEYPNTGGGPGAGFQASAGGSGRGMGLGMGLAGMALGGLGGRLMGMVQSFEHRMLWARCTGPGRLAVESQFEMVEDPGLHLMGSSPATSWRW
jgi:uncharacterized protein (AIM24 family)